MGVNILFFVIGAILSFWGAACWVGFSRKTIKERQGCAFTFAVVGIFMGPCAMITSIGLSFESGDPGEAVLGILEIIVLIVLVVVFIKLCAKGRIEDKKVNKNQKTYNKSNQVKQKQDYEFEIDEIVEKYGPVSISSIREHLSVEKHTLVIWRYLDGEVNAGRIKREDFYGLEIYSKIVSFNKKADN